jgi:hypothetical protein
MLMLIFCRGGYGGLRTFRMVLYWFAARFAKGKSRKGPKGMELWFF